MSGRERLRGPAVALLATVLALVPAELIFRAVSAEQKDDSHAAWEWRQRITEMNRTLYRRSDDPRLVYEPVPGARYDMGDWEAAFNARGFRGAPPPAVPAERRIVVLGDSVVWGEHLPVEQTTPHQLAGRLPDVDVFNLGVTGFDLAQETAWYERTGRPLSPTDVVVVFCLNDILLMSGPFNTWATEAELVRKEEQEAWLEEVAPIRAETVEWVMGRREQEARIRLLARARTLLRTTRYDRSEAYTDEFLLMYARPEAWAGVERSITELGAAIQADGARPWFVISPVLRLWGDYRWSGIHAQIGTAARAAGFEVIDPIEDWRGLHDPADLRFYGDSIHYGPAGHRVLARELAQRLTPP